MANQVPVRKKTKKRRRRRLRKSVLAGLIGLAAVSVLILSLIWIPGLLNDGKLKDLGYSRESIAAIKEQKLTSTILKGKLFSENLNTALPSETFKKDYLKLYLVTDSLSDQDFRLYDKLRAKNYSEDHCLTLFEKLEFWEMTPLLVFDYVTDVNGYVQDCMDHRQVNSQDHFELSGNYVTWYENTAPSDTSGLNMIVNKRYYLGESFVPEVTALPLTYASKNCTLQQEAADAFFAMCDELNAGGKPRMYASSSYRDYNYQVNLYNDYVSRNGQEWADRVSARPGFSEHQTGLTVDVASSTSGGLSKFADSAEFQWMQENAHRFGWILRYPQGKETITGYDYEAWHYRYLGAELATKVHESGLTYDEYYELYIK